MSTERGHTEKRILLTGCVIRDFYRFLTVHLFQIQVIQGKGYSKKVMNQRILYSAPGFFQRAVL